MFLTMNTWGIHAINKETFNNKEGQEDISKKSRDFIVTALKVTNTVLNILGYIPGISFFSGIVRIILGGAIASIAFKPTTFILDDDKSIEPWRKELIATGAAQAARGLLEIIPFGWTVNVVLDTAGSVHNITKECREETPKEAHPQPMIAKILPF